MSSVSLLPPPSGWRFSALGAVTALLLALLPLPGRATDMSLQAIGGETGSWSSNPLLAVEGARALYGSTTSPELIFKDTSPTSVLGLDTRIDESFFNQSVFNTTDAHETGNFTQQNQHWSFGTQEKVDYDTTRTSEITNFGLNPVVARHTGLSIAPQISYNPSAVDLLSLQGGVTSSTYQSQLFTNYETFSATPSYTHRFDPRDAAIFQLQAQRYQTTRGFSSTIDSVGPSAGWQFTFSPRFSANANIGAQTTREYQAGIPGTPWKFEYTFAGGLTFQGLQDNINASTARAQYPYGNGTEALQTNFTVTESHAITPLVALNIGGSYLTSTYQVDTSGNLKTQSSVNGGFTYHATEHVDLTGSYQYRQETLTSDSRKPYDNSFTLNLVLHPKIWTLMQ